MAKIVVKGVPVDYFEGVGKRNYSAGAYSVTMSYYTCGSYRMARSAVMEILKKYFPESVIRRFETYVSCELATLRGAEWRIYISVDCVSKAELKQLRHFRKEIEKEILAH